MDLTRAIGYRGFNLNSIVHSVGSMDMAGVEVTRAEWAGVEGVGYDEKRALADGFDSSDVFLSKRLISLSGNAYGRTRGEFFDIVQDLVTALTPTAAYDQSPGDRGFLPLDFYIPTADIDTWPDGYIHKQVFARPARQPSLLYGADTTGGDDGKPLSLPWNGLVECRDPRVYGYLPVEHDMNPSGSFTTESGTFINRGDYPAPLNILLVTGAASGGTVTFVAGGSNLTITVPNSGVQQIFRYSGREKILTYEVSNIETLRMDLLTFNAKTTHPRVPVGSSPWQWTRTAGVDILTGSRLWFWDAWA